MNTRFHPLLAAALVGPRDGEEVLEHRLQSLAYPVFATPKLDGIRIYTDSRVPTQRHGRSTPCCRSLLPVPNRYVHGLLSELDDGFDGEGMTYQPQDLFSDGRPRPHPFHRIQSDLMSHHGAPNFKFHVFACHVIRHRLLGYLDMVELLRQWDAPDYVVKVLPTQCDGPEELRAYMERCVAEGHEGICLRSRMSPQWKWTSNDGRSTLREQFLVKWKLFCDSEATVVGYEEELTNQNPPERDLRGLQARSSHKENMVGKCRLGALVCRTPEGVEFKVGTGLSAAQREEMWLSRESLVGQVVNYRHQPHGAQEAPRMPVFRAIRSPVNMS